MLIQKSDFWQRFRLIGNVVGGKSVASCSLDAFVRHSVLFFN